MGRKNHQNRFRTRIRNHASTHKARSSVVPAAEANLTRIPDRIPDEQAVYVCDMMSTGFVGAENAELLRPGASTPNARFAGSVSVSSPACSGLDRLVDPRQRTPARPRLLDGERNGILRCATRADEAQPLADIGGRLCTRAAPVFCRPFAQREDLVRRRVKHYEQSIWFHNPIIPI